MYFFHFESEGYVIYIFLGKVDLYLLGISDISGVILCFIFAFSAVA